MEAYLVLACNGHSSPSSIIDSGFSYCGSIVNPILDLSKIEYEKYDKVISFLDGTCGLFDQIERNRNKVSNIINLLCKTFFIIDDSMLKSIQMFMHMHKRCGFYLLLITKEDFECLMK